MIGQGEKVKCGNTKTEGVDEMDYPATRVETERTAGTGRLDGVQGKSTEKGETNNDQRFQVHTQPAGNVVCSLL